MMTDKGLTLQMEFTFNAPLEKVWDALTRPEIVKQYFFGTELETSWQPGSPIYWRGVWDGVSYEDKGAVLAYEPNKMLKYKYWSSFSGLPDLPENYAEISNAVREENGQTILAIVQNGIENEEKRAHSEQNWKMVMDGMAKVL